MHAIGHLLSSSVFFKEKLAPEMHAIGQSEKSCHGNSRQSQDMLVFPDLKNDIFLLSFSFFFLFSSFSFFTMVGHIAGMS